MPSHIRYFRGNYAYLSNFWIEKSGRSVEHYFQAAKTNDAAQSARILNAANPHEAKRIGRRVSLREDWETEKDAVMLTCLRYKFSDARLAKKLRYTADAVLIEGNDWGDTYWGMCDGVGKNMLGNMIMQIRSELSVAHFIFANSSNISS